MPEPNTVSLYVCKDANNAILEFAIGIDYPATPASQNPTPPYWVKIPNGLSPDHKSVVIGSATVELPTFAKRLHCYDVNGDAIVPHDPMPEHPDDPIDLDLNIPMAFKRANTVVNLGRL